MRIIATYPVDGRHLEAEIEGITIDQLQELLSSQVTLVNLKSYTAISERNPPYVPLNQVNKEDISDEHIAHWIRNLNVSAEVKDLLDRLQELVLKIGNTIINVGRKIIELAIKLARDFPNTAFGFFIAAIIGLLIGSIPLLGPVLGPLLMPLLLALGLAFGFWNDIQNKNHKKALHDAISVFRPLQAYDRPS